ncbi:hypothetical protein QBC38DRAFT_474991 [Podospora fimiseda]|uniref:Tetratricopeptide repeat protein 36 n=1 Tax=Podospora fimiseda TaxID=252190 RepID=A0AAN7BS03_9PEZI|nr:hypothetical protein QBC38DRAFT_474991 [Podospora fimiseda]
MAHVSLSVRDINVLEKIRDPESDPSRAIQIDPSLPKDPHISDPELYESISQQEVDIIRSLSSLGGPNVSEADVVEGYRKAVSRFGQLIEEYPHYASARNNRAQALRGLYGDSILIADAPRSPQALLHSVDEKERLGASKTALGDLDRAISLLSPITPHTKLSPQVVKTLAGAHVQRAGIYLITSKLMVSKSVSVDASRPESKWMRLDFEANASKDFEMAGRYGNEQAKRLAVAINPTAKLCGQMVREAMKREYGPCYASGSSD